VTALFEATPALKQLASIVDRVTYMASCELLLSPLEVSLARDSAWANVERPAGPVLSTLLERQIGSLEASRWKPHVRLIVAQLLLDANALYQADVNPVRRARVLLWWLEFKYNAGTDEEDDGQLGPVAHVADEIESLLTREVSFLVLRRSNTLKGRTYYRSWWTTKTSPGSVLNTGPRLISGARYTLTAGSTQTRLH